ncbi:MAG: glycosyltransferase N-terminal domain-containing protein [Paracoccus sp. (in: a-proteobacteria)]|uniref:3-deoxy-D-manno-octulosonic acid transferase n=1 Tax=Paracoccus sp. TaxID=267 RepID=UPI0026E04BC5|nr:glycosyltransferase N-terminal domain-containing protein [Paracoccus sp. (in: a-proteobacteria)]MDO5612897.1 glycosyltransferase N-terminal domain-containing protein [Paracoccus sp. (in: a-proteobacteria)]
MIYAATTRIAEAALRLSVLAGNATWRERLSLDTPPAPASVWIHAASVGELNSARVLTERLAADHRVIVTTNSTTGRDLARQRGLAARLAPFDSPGAVARFLDAVRPAVQLTIEGEFWPNRSALLAQRGVAQIMAGARISARSAARWGRLPGLIGPVLARLDGLSAQDAASQARLLTLGLPPAALLPRLDLKLLGPAAVRPPAPSPDRDRTFLAASTHEGEDGPVLDAFMTARAQVPGLRLILAPRHPDRADAIATLAAERGLTLARRSRGEDGDLLLADTLGEMALWYDRAGIVLVGGSLIDRGGHTPWEPAAHGCAILHGAYLSNFADTYAALDAAGAALAVGGDLSATVTALARDPARARAMGGAARALLTANAGDPEPLLARISALAHGARSPDI